jgi:hypothetical protein
MFQMVSNRHAAANLKGSLYFKKADIGLQSTLPHRSGDHTAVARSIIF